jgi:hypothetical protein
MSFSQLEADFQRKLRQYKSTYEDYLVEIKNQTGAYWNTEENVTISNKIESARIPFLTSPDITKEKCLHACSSDSNCKYVLFSDSGNGECAANQCLKWTKDAKGLIPEKNEEKTFNVFVGNSNSKSKTITLPELGIEVSSLPTNPQGANSSDKFKTEVKGDTLIVTRTDKQSGWGQMLQLRGIKKAVPGKLMINKGCAPGQGPQKTHYTYSGWEKPTWKDEENISFMGNPKEADPLMWKDLGKANSLLACKEMSVETSTGPFSSVVFVSDSNMCYGGIPEATQQNINMKGIYSAIPPTGSTALGGVNGVKYIEELRQLNADLKEILGKMRKALAATEKKDAKIAGQISEAKTNINDDYSKLNNDRKRLDQMSEEITILDAQLGLLDRSETRERMIYMGSAFLGLLLIAFAIRKYS